MKLAICFALLLLAGCVSQSKVLVNDAGKPYECTHSGWGWIGAPMAAHQQSECVKKAKAAGYHDPTEPKAN